jgi:F-type H+-transporting ATPase subunit c
MLNENMLVSINFIKGWPMDIFYVKAVACLSAAISVGVGVLGPSIGQGIIGMKACENIGKYPESANKIRQVMFTSMGIVETSSLWCVLIAGGLLFLVYTM